MRDYARVSVVHRCAWFVSGSQVCMDAQECAWCVNVRGCGGGSARMSTGLSECAVFRGCVGYTVHRARALPSGRICRRPPRPRPRCGRRAGAPGVRARVLGSQRGHREGFEAAGVAPGADTRRASRTFFTESCALCVYWRFLSLTFYISNKHDLFFYFFLVSGSRIQRKSE